MTNAILTITTNDGDEVLRVRLGEIDPRVAALVVLNALETMPKPRKPRSDRGMPRSGVTSV